MAQDSANSPVCQDCGNSATFRVKVEGYEIRHYDQDGELGLVENHALPLAEAPLICTECEGSNVEEP